VLPPAAFQDYGIMFQSYALFHLTVAQNVGYGLVNPQTVAWTDPGRG
jgi:ABC-type Fe3+/spermidine/putrescine transport system ATPase subunit